MKHVPGEPRPDRTTLIRVLAAATVVPVVGAMLIAWLVPRPPVVLLSLSLVAFLGQSAVFLMVVVPVARRAAFAVRPEAGEFRVTRWPTIAAVPLAWALLACIHLLLPNERAGGGAAMWLVFEAVLLGVAAWMFARPVVVSLSARGVTVAGLLGRARLYGWDELPEFPAIVSPGTARREAVLFVRPGRRRRLWLGGAWVNSRFLADAITYYRWVPEFRSAIGTPEEHRRLYAALVAAYAVSGGGRRSSVAAR